MIIGNIHQARAKLNLYVCVSVCPTVCVSQSQYFGTLVSYVIRRDIDL